LLGLSGAKQALIDELAQAEATVQQLTEATDFQPKLFEELLTLFELEND
jgi:geranylgeranyl diphosphate synthase, type II